MITTAALELQLLLGILLLVAALAAIVVFIVPLSRRSAGTSTTGTFKVGKHVYAYEIGDQIIRYSADTMFSGIEIVLPKKFPHIFLDAHKNDRTSEKPFAFESHNRISLEGNFNKYFQAYAPKDHMSLALSILTPDVLQVLLDTATKFDVEIISNHVRIVVPEGGVSANQALREELLEVAPQVMKEIDHRLRSWNESSLQGDAMLDVAAVDSAYVGRWIMPHAAVLGMTTTLLPAIVLWVVAIYGFLYRGMTADYMQYLFIAGLICFPGLYIVGRLISWPFLKK